MDQKEVKRIIEEIKHNQNFPRSRQELFKRVEFSALFQLAVACTKEMRKLEAGEGTSRQDVEMNVETIGKKKKAANVLLGFGERDLGGEVSMKVIPTKFGKLPYLLLDVRTKEEFLASHLKTAKHYPSTMLSRSNACEIEEMMYYKNKKEVLIILYGNDEGTAARVATFLMSRSYENIYLLCGGLKYANVNFPRELMAAVTAGHSPEGLSSAILASATAVQIKESLEYLSNDDVLVIEKYI